MCVAVLLLAVVNLYLVQYNYYNQWSAKSHKMTKACCVPFCPNRQYSHKPKNASLTFHEIPSKDPQRTEWITGIAKVYLELLNQPNWEPG